MRCHTEKGAFIPGCMGGAVYGSKDGCTCPSRAEMERDSQENIHALEARLLSLEIFVYKNVRRLPENDAVSIAKHSARQPENRGVDPAKEKE